VKQLKLFVLVFFSTVAWRCGDSDEKRPVLSDFEYFPLLTGSYFEYDVEEIRYALSIPETIQYDLRIVVADSFQNTSGTMTYVLHRAMRPAPGSAWEPLETWSARINGRQVILSEGNVPYVVLNFPAQKGNQWNGNSFNNEISPFTGNNEDIYMITEVGTSCVFPGVSYSDCLTIIQEDDEDPVLYVDKRSEQYVRKVGLVMKETIQLKYCTNEGQGCLGQQIVEEGVIYKQILKEYGKM
jgi:hypothetical protein